MVSCPASQSNFGVAHSEPDFESAINSDELLPSINRWGILSGVFLVSTVAVAIGIAAVSKYNVAVKALGSVRPEGEVRVVQSEVEGTVSQVMVRENQSVRRGDVIAQLNDDRQQLQKAQIQNRLEQHQLQIEQISTQVRSLDTQILAESNTSDRAITIAQAELARSQQEHQERQVTAQSELQETEAALSLAQDQMNRYQQLIDQGIVSQLQFKEKQTAVQMATVKLERAKAMLAPTLAPVTVAKEQISQEMAKGEATIAGLEREKSSLVQRQTEMQTEILRDRQELQQLENDLKKNVIRATADGILLKLELRNPSQMVRSGEAIAQIVPGRSPLVVKVAVPMQERGKVEMGQTVQLRVSACPYPDYGVLMGRVATISPDAVSPSADSPQSSTVKQFEVVVKPDATELRREKRRCQIQAGMDVEASIIAREETFLQFLLRKARLMTDL
jgi:HlyD family secretion protein